ncbi:MAG: FxLYD domain-containing protein [Anaerolineae bacterium]
MAACGGRGAVTAPTRQPAAGGVAGGTIHEIGGKEWEQVETDSPLHIAAIKLFFTGLGENAYVLGELENTGQQPVKDISVGVKAIAIDGTIIDNREWPVFQPYVAAGAKTPFKCSVDLRDVAKLELMVNSSPAESVAESMLEVVDGQMTEPKLGYVWISGEVRNISDFTAPGAEVLAVLRDASGAVVELGNTAIEQSIEPNESVPFKFAVLHRDATSFELLVRSPR